MLMNFFSCVSPPMLHSSRRSPHAVLVSLLSFYVRVWSLWAHHSSSFIPLSWPSFVLSRRTPHFLPSVAILINSSSIHNRLVPLSIPPLVTVFLVYPCLSRSSIFPLLVAPYLSLPLLKEAYPYFSWFSLKTRLWKIISTKRIKQLFFKTLSGW